MAVRGCRMLESFDLHVKAVRNSITKKLAAERLSGRHET